MALQSDYPPDTEHSQYAPTFSLIGLYQLINQTRDTVLDYVIMGEINDVHQRYPEYQEMCLSYIVYHHVQVDVMIPRIVAWAEQGGGLVSRVTAYESLAVFGGDRALESLLAGSRSTNDDQAIAALEAMRYVREVTPAIRERLEAVAADDGRIPRQEAARSALRSLDRDRQADEEIPRPHWFRYLRPAYDEDPAAGMLGELG